MVFDLLVFFIPPVLGALVNQSLNRALGGKFFSRWLWLAVIAGALGWEILAFSMPFRALWSELLYVVAGSLAVMLVMIAIPMDQQSREASSRGGCLRGMAMLFLPIVSFTLVGRVNHAQQIAVKLEGIVSQKYRSGNHNARSIVVLQSDQSTKTFEGVDQPAWDAIVQGRTHLSKPAWSANCDLDGRNMRFVPKAKVIFLGPFQD